MRALFGTPSVPTQLRHTWCVLEADRCRRGRRASHASASGGWRGGVACRNPLVKSTREAMRRWEGTRLELSCSPQIALRHWDIWQEKQTLRTSCDLSHNRTGNEYHRCQGVSRAAGDTPTIWGERWCALCGDDQNRLCTGLTGGFFFFFYTKVGVTETRQRSLSEYILLYLMEERLCARVRLSEARFLIKIAV